MGIHLFLPLLQTLNVPLTEDLAGCFVNLRKCQAHQERKMMFYKQVEKPKTETNKQENRDSAFVGEIRVFMCIVMETGSAAMHTVKAAGVFDTEIKQKPLLKHDALGRLLTEPNNHCCWFYIFKPPPPIFGVPSTVQQSRIQRQMSKTSQAAGENRCVKKQVA